MKDDSYQIDIRIWIVIQLPINHRGDDLWWSRITADINANVEKHEWVTYEKLACRGHVLYIPAIDNQKNVKNPDVLMDGVFTEIKSPKGDGNKTIINRLRHASKQASRVVIDMFRSNLSHECAVAQINESMRQFSDRLEWVILIRRDDGTMMKCNHCGEWEEHHGRI